MKLRIWHYIVHWLRFWCKPKLIRVNGDVMVKYNCMVCAKRDVTPEAWERVTCRKSS